MDFLDKNIKIHEYIELVDEYAEKTEAIKKYFSETLPKTDIKSLRKY